LTKRLCAEIAIVTIPITLMEQISTMQNDYKRRVGTAFHVSVLSTSNARLAAAAGARTTTKAALLSEPSGLDGSMSK
jgi:hypothetical protein